MSKITFGLDMLAYAKKTVAEDGTVTYATPVMMPGASEMSLDPVGDATPVYADNKKYVVVHSNQGYDGTLSVYGVPEAFCLDILGMTKDANGALIENGNDVAAEFALLGQFMSETTEKKRWVLYNCTAGRTSFAGKTKEESIEAQLYEIPITAAPADDTGDVKAAVTGTDADAAFKGWFKAVYTKATTPVPDPVS